MVIVEILKNTPSWVFVLFFVLLYLGYGYSKTRAVPVGRLFALPLAMVGLSLYGVWSAFGANLAGFAAWTGGIVLALLLNLVIKLPKGVDYAPAEKEYIIPGSWFPLSLMMAIFFTKYAVAVALARHPSLREAATFITTVTLGYGFLSGVFLSRALHAWGTAKTAPAASRRPRDLSSWPQKTD